MGYSERQGRLLSATAKNSSHFGNSDLVGILSQPYSPFLEVMGDANLLFSVASNNWRQVGCIFSNVLQCRGHAKTDICVL